MANVIANTNAFGADMLRFATLKGELETSPLFFCFAYAQRMTDLAERITDAIANKGSARKVVLDAFEATPEGETFKKEYDRLVAMKPDSKSAEQKVKQADMLKTLNAINMQAQRNVQVMQGLNVLRKLDRKVLIKKIAGQKSKYACYVTDNGDADALPVPFTVAQIIKLAALQDANVLASDMTTENIADATRSEKKGAANADKGNVAQHVKKGDVAAVAASLDTTLAGRKIADFPLKDRASLVQLWAQLDATLTAEEKANAKKAFDALAAKPKAA